MTAYRDLKERAWEANLEIPRQGLAICTFGNVSAFDAARGVLAIKPSGVEYEMRRGLPVQLAATCLALVLWLASPFLH